MSRCASLAHTIVAFFVGVSRRVRRGVLAAAFPPAARTTASTTAPTPHLRGGSRLSFAEGEGDVRVDVTTPYDAGPGMADAILGSVRHI